MPDFRCKISGAPDWSAKYRPILVNVILLLFSLGLTH